MLIGIWAMGKNGEFGLEGDLPWKRSYPTDLKWFQWVTSTYEDAILVVGSETAKTLPPLKGRTVKVISRNGGISFDEVREMAKTHNVICIGGSYVISELIDEFNVMHVTKIAAEFKHDTKVFGPTGLIVERFVVNDLDGNGVKVEFGTYRDDYTDADDCLTYTDFTGGLNDV